MKRLFLPVLLTFLAACAANNSDDDKRYILDSMKMSQEAWNSGDLDGFMHNYWKSDSLKFIGKTSITYGWQETLDRYKNSYPDMDAMGKLKFDFIHLDPLDDDHYLQVGKYTQFRKTDTLSGHFTLTWERIDGEWRIIADHSS